VQVGGGGWSTIVRGGGKKQLTFPGVKAASDVELQPSFIFSIPKKTGGNLTCGPPSLGGALTSLLIKKRQSLAFVLRYYF
jgi:hypothetical protein